MWTQKGTAILFIKSILEFNSTKVAWPEGYKLSLKESSVNLPNWWPGIFSAASLPHPGISKSREAKDSQCETAGIVDLVTPRKVRRKAQNAAERSNYRIWQRKTCFWDKGKILEELAKKAEKKTRGSENEHERLVLHIQDWTWTIFSDSSFLSLWEAEASKTPMLLCPFWTQKFPVWEVSVIIAGIRVSGKHSPRSITGKGASNVRKVALQWSCRAACPKDTPTGMNNE